VKRYFDVSPYLIIEQEGHWEQHSFHFDGSGSIRRWLLEYGVFLSSCKKKQRGCIIASNSEKMDGLQAKFSLWGLGLSSSLGEQAPILVSVGTMVKVLPTFSFVSIFSL
jgi:hypothetical protein